MWLDSFREGDPVLIDGWSGTAVTRAALEARGGKLRQLVPSGGLVFLLAESSLNSVATFHALMSAGIPVALLDALMPWETTSALIDRYKPELVLGMPTHVTAEQYEVCRDEHLHVIAVRKDALGTARSTEAGVTPVHADLAVLLTTSGSTGSPKLVRLSRVNIRSNARQIASSLSLTTTDRGITALPFHYSFGMSVLTSHASIGSPVLVTSASVLEPALWEQISTYRVTTFPGVPQTYQMLRRLQFGSHPMPAMRAMLQAGGRLAPDLIEEFSTLMGARGGEFFVMYGQTEASPRIACLPPASLADKLGSAGVALEGGRLEARDQEGGVLPPGETGEIHYTGPNVMMGYAESREDLTLGDIQGDTLATGDLGYVDDDGFLFLSGRSKRIAKVAGLRISLDEVEAMVPDLPGAAVEAPAGTITIATDTADAGGTHKSAARALARRLRVPPKSIRVIHLPAIPLLPSGKVDYRAVAAFVEED